MKERPNLEEVITDIQKMIDENQRSYVRYIHLGTLMDILHLLKEREPKPPVVKEPVLPPSHLWQTYSQTWHGECPKCGADINEYDNSKCCGRCGQAVKW